MRGAPVPAQGHHGTSAAAADESAGARGRARSLISSFDDACQFLFPRTAGKIKWGLDTTRALLASLGNPHRHFASVHIGGTNGKGSTSAFLTSMLRAAGHSVGLYTSPHLISVLERFQVNGRPMGEEPFTRWTRRLEPLATQLNASFFEITTAIAFADFAARGVEIAVVEVGLGGRLDSTNVIEPLAAGVTRIALEHTEYLGDTLEAIAREKAGIAKPGVPFLTTEADATLRAVLGATAVPPDKAAGHPLGLRGGHQVANASLALALAESLPERWRPDGPAIHAGLASARLPGRFDRRGRYLFDVAHNPDGMRALVAALNAAELPRPVTAIVATLKDKDQDAMLEILRPAVDDVVIARAPSAPNDRVRASGMALADALARASSPTVVVTGSFHTVGDAMRLLGIDP